MTSSSIPSPYPSPGEIIDGKYQIERTLGEGGMGCVARAYHMLLRAPVALKFMNPQFVTFPGAVERFINEGIASKKIRSDHVVPVEDVGKLPSGAPYLVMPCLEGLDLADLLARDGTPGLPSPRAVHFTLQILRGLQAAHANGIIHRDMKPSNCFVVKHDGESDFVRILDFGISKVVQPGSNSLTRTNSALGTPLYMSPEQARSPRDVDTRSDLYSVGVILYELLTGQTPFFSEDGEFTEILYKLFTTDPPPIRSKNPDVDEALATVVHHALARNPADRYTTALDMAEALAPFSDERSARLLARMRSFKPEQIVTMPPPSNMPLPNSLVAFSKLDARPATDVMANRPVAKPTPGDAKNGTEVLVSSSAAPSAERAHGTEILEKKVPRSATIPLGNAADRDHDDAVAKTQYGDTNPSYRPAGGPGSISSTPPPRARIAGAQTDLGSVSDAPPRPETAAGKKGVPLPLIAVAAIAVVGAIGFGVLNRSTPPAPGGRTSETPTASPPTTGPIEPKTAPANVPTTPEKPANEAPTASPPEAIDAGTTSTTAPKASGTPANGAGANGGRKSPRNGGDILNKGLQQ